METQKEELEIDIFKLIKALWHWAWAIVLVTAICGGAARFYAIYRITPMYQADVLIHVNNSTISLGNGFAITPGELAAAQSLAETYAIILKSRSTLNEVIERADLNYSYEMLCSMVFTSTINETEILGVSVISPDPQEAALIANTIAEVLPEKIADIVDGSSVRIVDYAEIPSYSISPNISKYTAIGLLIGASISCAVIVIFSLLDTTISSEDYLTQNYDIPVLAVIPELSEQKVANMDITKKQVYRKKRE